MSSAEPRADDPSRVGATFVKGYYLQLAQDPQGLATFYSKDSCLTVIDSPSSMEHPHVAHGPQEILGQIKALGLYDVKTKLSSVVFQPSLQGGVLVITTGAISSGEEKFRGFTQVFVLAKRKEKQYFIQNEALYLVQPSEPEEAEAEPESEPEAEAEVEPTYEEPAEPTPAPVPVSEPAEHTPTNWADDEEESPREAAISVAQADEHEEEVEVAQHEVSPSAPAPAPVPAPAPPVASKPVAAPVAPAREEGERQTFAEILRHTAASSAPWGVVQRTTATVTSAPRPPPAQLAPVPQKPQRRPPQQPSTQRPTTRPTVGSKSPSVYVARVPVGTTEEVLVETFGKYGQVVQVRNREAKRIAFVDFANDEGVQKAIAAANDGLVVIKGQTLVVQAQKEKEEIAPRELASAPEDDGEVFAGKITERRGGGRNGRGRGGRGRDNRGRQNA